jgi:hypothetical protein
MSPALAQPDKVVVLIGGNDVLSRVSKSRRRFLGAWKRFPREPWPAWYEENWRRIVRDLTSRTGARVALGSLQPVGEDSKSQDPFQKQLNQLVREYSAIVERVAREEGVVYIPF